MPEYNYSDGLYLPNGTLGVGVAANNASAASQIDSTTKGFLPPRMTTVQRNAIATPATGLFVFDTDLAAYYFYNGSAWTAVSSSFTSTSQIITRVRSNKITPITSGTTYNVCTTTNIVLTAGEWEMSAMIVFAPTGSYNELTCAISTVSASLVSSDYFGVPTAGEVMTSIGGLFTGNSNEIVVNIPAYRVTVATTKTLYLCAKSVHTTGANSVCGSMSAFKVG